jgi:hypothetical protein
MINLLVYSVWAGVILSLSLVRDQTIKYRIHMFEASFAALLALFASLLTLVGGWKVYRALTRFAIVSQRRLSVARKVHCSIILETNHFD